MVTEAGNTAGAALQEVEYRVCDNLQLGISLLALQARSERDAAAQRALTQAQARVAVVARLHEQMVASGSRAGLDYAACARELATDALAAVRSRQGAALDFCCPGALLLRPEVTVPLSLVLWELLDNAVRHAFADGSASTLTLRIAREEGQLRLLVADDGVGLAPGLDPAPAQAVQASRWLRRCCSSSAARSRFSTRGAALHAWWPCHCRRMRRQLPAHKVCNATMQQHCHNSMRQSMDWTGERSR
jgi:two-component sensor histidine kinase